MRRIHCEITDPKGMVRILGVTHIGRLATMDSEGYPYITPVNFVYHEGCVYFHCAPEGEKLDNLIRNPRVCFEVDIPLAYLQVDFNPERDPCRTHQFYQGGCTDCPRLCHYHGELKTKVLNALAAKHEGNWNFPAVSPDSASYKGCKVIEITPERMTAKSDLAQNKPQTGLRLFIAEHLAGRGLPGDLEAVQAMGYKLGGNEGRWRIKK
jgi:uncharacterized protein